MNTNITKWEKRAKSFASVCVAVAQVATSASTALNQLNKELPSGK